MGNDRVIVLAPDAASPRLLREWARDGTLPNLRHLMERGLSGDIKGLDGFYIGSTWPSLYTGVNPGRHGFHYQTQLLPGTYRLRRVAEGEPTRVNPFRHALSDAGRRVAFLDVPLSKLDPGINGLQIVEWGVHDALDGFGAVPSSIERLILERYGPPRVGSACDAARGCAADYDEFTRRLLRSIDAKSRLTADVLALEPWDFLIQVFPNPTASVTSAGTCTIRPTRPSTLRASAQRAIRSSVSTRPWTLPSGRRRLPTRMQR